MLNSSCVILRRPGSGIHIHEGDNPYNDKAHPAARRNLPHRVCADDNARPTDRQRQRQPVDGRRSQQEMQHRHGAAHARSVQTDLPSHVRPGGNQPEKKTAQQESRYRRGRTRRPQYDKPRKAARGTHQQGLLPVGSHPYIESIHLPARDEKTHVKRRQTGRKQQTGGQPSGALHRWRREPTDHHRQQAGRCQRGTEYRR